METFGLCCSTCHGNGYQPGLRQGYIWIPGAFRASSAMVRYPSSSLSPRTGVHANGLRYLLYICDHHFSIVYGRPPMIQDQDPMRKFEVYLSSPMATEGDSHALSQVTLFTIQTRIFYFFEDEAVDEVSEDKLSHIPVFCSQLEHWRETWRSRLRMSPSSPFFAWARH